MTEAREALARRVGRRFARPELFLRALVHRGAARAPGQSNERLEFLGDRVLALVVARLLHDRFALEDEGALSRRLSALVRRETLAGVAAAIGLGPALTLARGEDAGGGRANPGLLADACEALIGALYLDGGIEAAETFVRREWEDLVGREAVPPMDARTALQELVQARGLALPSYRVVAAEGPDHAPRFTVSVGIAGEVRAEGAGPTKQAASEAAAQALLSNLGPNLGPRPDRG